MSEKENLPEGNGETWDDNLPDDLAGSEELFTSNNTIDPRFHDERERIKTQLVTNKNNKAMCCDTNYAIIFNQDPVLKHVAFNLMGADFAWQVGYEPSWIADDDDRIREKEKAAKAKAAGRRYTPMKDWFLTPRDYNEIYAIVRFYFDGMYSNQQHHERALNLWASRRRYHAMREFVKSLEWDGTERIDCPFPAFEVNPYTTGTFHQFFIDIIRRLFEPGCQADYILVLVGDQGVRKTSWLRSIFPMDAVELDAIPTDNSSKDEIIRCHESPLAILDEIEKYYTKIGASELKAFATRTRDRFRRPYAKTDSRVPRSFVLAGTTNEVNFLVDVTGNRRFRPVTVTETIPDEFLTREYMDQLLAEAYHYYVTDQYVDHDPALAELAIEHQQAHLDDPIGDAVRLWLEEPKEWLPLLESDGRQKFDKSGKPIRYPQWVPVKRLSVRYIIEHVESLKDINPHRDKKAVRAITAALDDHPDYVRMTGSSSYRVGDHTTKTAWERTTGFSIEQLTRGAVKQQ